MSQYSKTDVDLQSVGLTENDMVLEDFDAAEVLTSLDSVVAFLDAAIKTKNFAYFQQAMNTAARAKGMGKLAESAGITREGAYKALRVGTEPKMRTMMGLLDALGMEFSIVPKEVTENDNSYSL